MLHKSQRKQIKQKGEKKEIEVEDITQKRQ